MLSFSFWRRSSDIKTDVRSLDDFHFFSYRPKLWHTSRDTA